MHVSSSKLEGFGTEGKTKTDLRSTNEWYYTNCKDVRPNNMVTEFASSLNSQTYRQSFKRHYSHPFILQKGQKGGITTWLRRATHGRNSCDQRVHIQQLQCFLLRRQHRVISHLKLTSIRKWPLLKSLHIILGGIILDLSKRCSPTAKKHYVKGWDGSVCLCSDISDNVVPKPPCTLRILLPV